MKSTISLMLAAAFLFAAPAAHAADPLLMPEVARATKAPLVWVGSTVYHKFFLKIYEATLWAPGGQWSPTKPYALQLRYTKDLSKDTLVDAVYDDIKQNSTADAATLASWKGTLKESLPAVKENDVLVGLYEPGKTAQLFFNGQKQASITDTKLAEAFFAIWLGPNADATMKAELTNNK